MFAFKSSFSWVQDNNKNISYPHYCWLSCNQELSWRNCSRICQAAGVKSILCTCCINFILLEMWNRFPMCTLSLYSIMCHSTYTHLFSWTFMTYSISTWYQYHESLKLHAFVFIDIYNVLFSWTFIWCIFFYFSISVIVNLFCSMCINNQDEKLLCFMILCVWILKDWF